MTFVEYSLRGISIDQLVLNKDWSRNSEDHVNIPFVNFRKSGMGDADTILCSSIASRDTQKQMQAKEFLEGYDLISIIVIQS